MFNPLVHWPYVQYSGALVHWFTGVMFSPLVHWPDVQNSGALVQWPDVQSSGAWCTGFMFSPSGALALCSDV